MNHAPCSTAHWASDWASHRSFRRSFHRSFRRPSRSWLLAAALFVGPAVPELSAQMDRADADVFDKNGHPFRTPAGSPLDPIHRIAVVSTDRAGERRTVAFADLGDRLGFWVRRDPTGTFELAGAVLGGAQSRFDLESPNNDFIEVHYRVGFQLRARIGSVAARAELYHVSSHLGDEVLVATGRAPISTSREGLDLLLQGSPIAGLVLYGGPGLVLRSTEGFRTLSVRGGADWESPRTRGLRPYASADFFSWSELDWDPSISIEAGLALGTRTRLGFLAGTGPSRAEQFFRENERVFGLSVSYLR